MGLNYFIQMAKKDNNIDLKNIPIIAINGVSSFVGSHLAIHFSKKNYIVFGLISKPFKSYESIRKKRLNICKKFGVKIQELDLLKRDKIIDFISFTKPDYFIHHAAWTENANSINFDLNKALLVNVSPLRTIYEEMSKYCSKGIIITGTNAEYGDIQYPCLESDNCMPTTPYGLSKLSETVIAYQLSNQFDLPTRVGRIFNPLGPLDNPRKLIPSLIKEIKLNREFKLSSCSQVRDFIYVGDLVDGFQKLSMDLNRGGFDIFNLSSGEGISVKSLIELIADKLAAHQSLLKFNSLPLRIGESNFSVGDNNKAIKILQWEPTSIKEMIYKAVDEILNEDE